MEDRPTPEDVLDLDTRFRVKGVFRLPTGEPIRLRAMWNAACPMMVTAFCAELDPKIKRLRETYGAEEWLPGEVYAHLSMRPEPIMCDVMSGPVRVTIPIMFRPWLFLVKTWGEGESFSEAILKTCPELFVDTGIRCQISDHASAAMWSVEPMRIWYAHQMEERKKRCP